MQENVWLHSTKIEEVRKCMQRCEGKLICGTALSREPPRHPFANNSSVTSAASGRRRFCGASPGMDMSWPCTWVATTSIQWIMLVIQTLGFSLRYFFEESNWQIHQSSSHLPRSQIEIDIFWWEAGWRSPGDMLQPEVKGTQSRRVRWLSSWHVHLVACVCQIFLMVLQNRRKLKRIIAKTGHNGLLQSLLCFKDIASKRWRESVSFAPGHQTASGSHRGSTLARCWNSVPSRLRCLFWNPAACGDYIKT